MRDEAAEHIQFIRPGNGYEQVSVLDARLGLDGVRCTVARDAHDIQLGCQPVDARGIGVHNRNIVAFLVELGGECLTDLATADNDDIHGVSFISFGR